ncbi:ethylene-responsive transcription factor ERF017-like [Hibiscus syriacus]|uniref:ethylene-responsive transcription factor ERF017-like n=1 Tax=Hibiscus syriacus TaxID=106335 RepID=UPI001921B1CC|nr:ethylene-responsive transcription factor ERF017-like [Hibiscus syriacus]
MVKQDARQNPASEAESERSHAQYKGARKRKWGKWVSEIRLPNSRERIWLGSYDTPEKAARAFDAALFCLRGRSAKFNFPHNPPEIANGRSLTPSEIQTVAARFANSNPPRTQTESPSPSVSVETVRLESEFAAEGSFLDVLKRGSGYGIFPEWDEFSSEFLGSTIPVCEDDTVDGNHPESFLWNF